MDQSNRPFDGAEVIIFCDETKFSKNNGDVEDAIFYFGIAADTAQIPSLDKNLKEIFKNERLQAPVFHSTQAFKERQPRNKLMMSLTKLIIDNRLRCFCFKYQKDNLYQISADALSNLNNNIINFNNREFQALFYFLIHLNAYLKDKSSYTKDRKVVMYFDRNVYAANDTEAFNFPSDLFVIKRMTFTEKSKISLLALADFFGFLFRKSKISYNKGEHQIKLIEDSRLTMNSYLSVIEITEAKLFHFLEVDPAALMTIIQNKA